MISNNLKSNHFSCKSLKNRSLYYISDFGDSVSDDQLVAYGDNSNKNIIIFKITTINVAKKLKIL